MSDGLRVQGFDSLEVKATMVRSIVERAYMIASDTSRSSEDRMKALAYGQRNQWHLDKLLDQIRKLTRR